MDRYIRRPEDIESIKSLLCNAANECWHVACNLCDDDFIIDNTDPDRNEIEMPLAPIPVITWLVSHLWNNSHPPFSLATPWCLHYSTGCDTVLMLNKVEGYFLQSLQYFRVQINKTRCRGKEKHSEFSFLNLFAETRKVWMGWYKQSSTKTVQVKYVSCF